MSHAGFHPGEHSMGSEAKNYNAKAYEEGVQLEIWHVAKGHLLILRDAVDYYGQNSTKERKDRDHADPGNQRDPSDE